VRPAGGARGKTVSPCMERHVPSWNVFKVEGEGTRHPGQESSEHFR
jgi:hypothetical protein